MIKRNKRFAVITASDYNNGDFLINHWLKSLLKNIDTNIVEVIILDYGLSEYHKKIILSNGAKVIKCVRDGHVVNIRYRDMLRIIKKRRYKQILTCDSGDIIFQRNIMELFDIHPSKFRAVCEDMSAPMLEYTLLQKPFLEEITEDIKITLRNKKMINGGLVLADVKNFQKLCEYMMKYIINKKIFGPDQIILNYVLYKNGFVNLGRNFNYVLTTVKDKFKIKNGVFFMKNGDVISVVHNAGGNRIFRPIKNFGYGPEYNNFNHLTYYLLRIFYRLNFVSKPVLRFFELKNIFI